MDERQRFQSRSAWHFLPRADALLVLAASAIVLAFSPAFADSTSVDRSETESYPISEPYRVELKDGESVPAAFVRSWWNDYVRITDRFGHDRFIHANRVAAVLDSTGQDVTRPVVNGRKHLGTQPAFVEPPRVLKVRTYHSPLRAKIAQGSFFRRVGSFDDNRSGILLTQIDVGGLWKVGDRYGIGGTVFFSGDDEVRNVGLKTWGRRLLNRDLVLDVAPGVVLASDDDYIAHNFAPAFVCETGLTFHSWLSLTGLVEARERSMSPEMSGSHTEWAWYCGLKLGGYAAGPAMFLSALTVAAAHSITEYSP